MVSRNPCAQAEVDLAALGAGDRDRGAGDHGEDRGEREGPGVGVAVDEVEEEAAEHERAEHEDQPAEDVADGTEVDHAGHAPASRGRWGNRGAARVRMRRMSACSAS